MNANESSPMNPDQRLNERLTEFFRTETPQPWPHPPIVSESPFAVNARSGGDALRRSRLALAASVALLVGGAWLLSGKVRDGKPRSDMNLDDGSASTDVLKAPVKAKTPKK